MVVFSCSFLVARIESHNPSDDLTTNDKQVTNNERMQFANKILAKLSNRPH